MTPLFAMYVAVFCMVLFSFCVGSAAENYYIKFIHLVLLSFITTTILFIAMLPVLFANGRF